MIGWSIRWTYWHDDDFWSCYYRTRGEAIDYALEMWPEITGPTRLSRWNKLKSKGIEAVKVEMRAIDD